MKSTALEIMANWASKDATRPHLNYLHHCEASQAMVATDGYRLIQCKELYDPNGKPINAVVFAKTGEIMYAEKSEFKTINYKALWPTDHVHRFTWRVPALVGKLKTGMKKPEAWHVVKFAGDYIIVIGKLSKKMQRRRVVSFNPSLFHGLEEKELNIFCKNTNTPIEFDCKELNLSGLIMPMRY